MQVFLNFERIKIDDKNKFYDLSSLVSGKIVSVNFSFFKDKLISLSIKSRDDFLYLYLYEDEKSFQQKLIQHFLFIPSRVIFQEYENFIREYFKCFSLYPEAKNIFDLKTFIFLLEGKTEEKLENLLSNYQIEHGSYSQIKKQTEVFYESRFKENENDFIFVPFNLCISCDYELCSSIFNLYEGVIRKSQEQKNYKDLNWLHDNVYVDLYRELQVIEKNGIKVNFFQLQQLNSNKKYVKLIQGRIDKDWMIYSSYDATSSITGRTSSKGKLNFCSIPKEIKNYIIPYDSNSCLVTIDYNAVDIRTALALGGYNKEIYDRDLYLYVCKNIFGVDENSDKFLILRDKVKLLLFKLLYSHNIEKTIESLELSEEEKKLLINFDLIQFLIFFNNKITEELKGKEFVRNSLGRIKQHQEEKSGTSIGFLVQSISNMISLKSLILVNNYFERNKLEHKIILFEHDAITINLSTKNREMLNRDFTEISNIMEKISPEIILKKKGVVFPVKYKAWR